MAEPTRCNPFGSNHVRFTAPCVADADIIAKQARAQWLRQQDRFETLQAKIVIPLSKFSTDALCSFSAGFSEGFAVCSLKPRAFPVGSSLGFS